MRCFEDWRPNSFCKLRLPPLAPSDAEPNLSSGISELAIAICFQFLTAAKRDSKLDRATTAAGTTEILPEHCSYRAHYHGP